MNTPIQYIETIKSNKLYIKREDLIPYSFGGNKARKALLFYEKIDKGNFDCVVTYGSSHSNHCRVISNMAISRNLRCYIISPSEVSEITFNSKLMNMFGADITHVPVEKVHNTINNKIEKLKAQGMKPYFIPGGGHGNIGTQAYVNCYEEIKTYEKENNINFDYIFFASGTGTTQAGLVCGQLIHRDTRKIIGISIARSNPKGRDIVIESIKEYTSQFLDTEIEKSTIFTDEYIGDGYGRDNQDIINVIRFAMEQYGIPLDSTYTGKAFFGMKKYIDKNKISNSNILFLHTGGTPLFFDDLGRLYI